MNEEEKYKEFNRIKKEFKEKFHEIKEKKKSLFKIYRLKLEEKKIDKIINNI